jgi:hypothetical protein
LPAHLRAGFWTVGLWLDASPHKTVSRGAQCERSEEVGGYPGGHRDLIIVMEEKHNGQGKEDCEKEGSVNDNPPFGTILGVPHEEAGPVWGNQNSPCPQIAGAHELGPPLLIGKTRCNRRNAERVRRVPPGAGMDLDNWQA